jgi:hypothetical protein
MSAGSISLTSAIVGCNMNTGWANRIQSDRFLNPDNMLCPIWNGMDTAGRQVCPDSFVTKRAGCNSALDRVAVENNLRPQYAEYINLSALGLQGPPMGVNGGGNPNNQNTIDIGKNVTTRQAAHNPNNPVGTGNFGSQFNEIYPTCNHTMKNGKPAYENGYERYYANQSQQERFQQAQQMGYQANQRRTCGGN